MWSSAGLGPPTYHMFPAYDDYRGGMSEFAGGTAGLAGAGGSWVTAGTTSPPAAPQTPVTSPNETEESKSLLLWGGISGDKQNSGGLAGANSSTAASTNLGGGGSNTSNNNVVSSGAGSQGGLAHWMTVVAEHMNPETSSIHPAYMWNGIESKIGMDIGSQESMQAAAAVGYQRPQSSTSLSPPASGLVVPQPINPRLSGQMGMGQIGAGLRKYQCKMCPQLFASKADLQLHTQLHMREPKPYKCATCNKAFANSSYLSQHTRIHLGIKPYRCEICQRKFTQLSHLQQHIRTHTGDKPYKCRIPGCTKAFSQLSNLQSHSRCHQTDKPYKCNSCYKCFTEEAALLEHIPKHKDSKHVKTHICSYCGKSYTQETYLAKHMQKHSDRLDKRNPIIAPGTQTAGSGLMADPYSWPKVDPMAAVYSYTSNSGVSTPAAATSALLSDTADPRDVSAYTPPWSDIPRTASSTFSILNSATPPTAVTAVTDSKTLELDVATSHFSRHNGGQEVKYGSLISLSQIREYSSGEKKQEN